jgi:hypothetical protein
MRQRFFLALIVSLVVLGIALVPLAWAWLYESQRQLDCALQMIACVEGNLLQVLPDPLAQSTRQFLLVLSFVALLWFLLVIPWIRSVGRAAKVSDPEYIRGAVRASEDAINDLTQSVRTKEPGPHIQIGKIDIPRRIEPLSFLMCGSPGSGKTTAIMSALSAITRRSTDKVAIYDRNGDYARKFFNQQRGDVILGLGELATATWNIWNEFPDGRGFQAFVELVIPKEQGTTYWVDNGRIVLLELIKKVHSWKQLRQMISTAPLATIATLLQGTAAYRPLMSKYGEEILSGVNSRTAWLDLLEDPNPLEEPIAEKTDDAFSFLNWATDETSAWVYIVVPERYRVSFAPILTVYFDLIAQAVMERKVDHTGYKRLWLVCDELSSARYQPRLADYLAEGRKFGGCAILGFQLISQIRAIYGPDETETIFGLCQSKLILRTTDGSTCKFLAEMLGTQDYFEPTYSLSKNDKTQTTSQGYQRRNDYLFLPSEIKDLPQYNGILVMPTYPTSQVEIDRQSHLFPDVPLPTPRSKFASSSSEESSVSKPVLTLVRPLSQMDEEQANQADSQTQVNYPAEAAPSENSPPRLQKRRINLD